MRELIKRNKKEAVKRELLRIKTILEVVVVIIIVIIIMMIMMVIISYYKF